MITPNASPILPEDQGRYNFARVAQAVGATGGAAMLAAAVYLGAPAAHELAQGEHTPAVQEHGYESMGFGLEALGFAAAEKLASVRRRQLEGRAQEAAQAAQAPSLFQTYVERFAQTRVTLPTAADLPTPTYVPNLVQRRQAPRQSTIAALRSLLRKAPDQE